MLVSTVAVCACLARDPIHAYKWECKTSLYVVGHIKNENNQ